MKHYGDITTLSGYELPVVDIIVGGSPCQDLSIAGARKGLAGERSGLFMEQIRIVKEMRERDRAAGRSAFLCRCRFMVWENVPGVFSLSAGADFQAVLEEVVKVVCAEAPPVPIPKQGWPKAGCISGVGDSGCPFSVAWRVHDAQFWGVAQRRRRVALVADFGGLSAPEILFERRGLQGYPEPGESQGESVAGGTEGGAGKTISFQERARKPGGGKGILIQDEHVGALSTVNNQMVLPFNATQITCPTNGSHPRFGDPCHAIASTDRPPVIIDARGAYCLQGDGIGRADTAGCNGKGVAEEVAYTLNTIDRHAVLPTAPAESDLVLFEPRSQDGVPRIHADVCPTLNTAQGGQRQPSIARNGNSVRRLTPLECARLQDYPDDWLDIGDWTDSKGKVHKNADTLKYKALGNSIALPFWKWLARRICAQYERSMTMGSLFDGIGGFPLCFEAAGCRALWASEIDEYCIAVTKKHFPEEEDDG